MFNKTGETVPVENYIENCGFVALAVLVSLGFLDLSALQRQDTERRVDL